MVKETITWIDANGFETSLSDESTYEVLLGTKGFYMPPIDFVEDEVPFHHGSLLRNVKVRARDLDVPLVIRGKDEIDKRDKLRNLQRFLNPLKGSGRIKVTSYDGSERELRCLYIGGLEIDESSGLYNHRIQKAVLVFRAFDPFWYDTFTNVLTFTIGQPATFFPFFPLRLTSSSVFADTTVTNIGDVETWPEWIITGPGENIVLRNLTTGEITHLETSLEVGESITIDTGLYKKTITKNNGENLYYTLTDESSLWSLQEGINSIRIEMSNSNKESSVQLSYRNRYLGV